jgi:hypothetical protein
MVRAKPLMRLFGLIEPTFNRWTRRGADSNARRIDATTGDRPITDPLSGARRTTLQRADITRREQPGDAIAADSRPCVGASDLATWAPKRKGRRTWRAINNFIQLLSPVGMPRRHLDHLATRPVPSLAYASTPLRPTWEVVRSRRYRTDSIAQEPPLLPEMSVDERSACDAYADTAARAMRS